jgi:DNA-directed RNA polymerase specialized sigma24 family protein
MIKEIALSMQISEETVKKRVQRARLALAQCVQDGNPQ